VRWPLRSVSRGRSPRCFPRRGVLPWAKAARRLLGRSPGKRRRQALCRRVEMRPTGHWASANPGCTRPGGACGTAISAPSLRLPLCRHAMGPVAFRRRVRRLTSGTCLRFPGHLCGDRQLAVTAHAHLIGVTTAVTAPLQAAPAHQATRPRQLATAARRRQRP
jgi:hypothetical protein